MSSLFTIKQASNSYMWVSLLEKFMKLITPEA